MKTVRFYTYDRALLPIFPNFGAKPDGCFFTVSDYRRFDKRRVFKQLLKLVGVVSQIAQNIRVLRLCVYQSFKPDAAYHALKLAWAHSDTRQIDTLKFHVALLEVTLGFLRVEAF